MAKQRSPEPAELYDLPVAFGGVSIGDATARIGVTIDRQELKLSEADKHLCEKRLTGRIITRPGNPEQGSLPGVDLETSLRGTFDVKGLRVSADEIAIGLTFQLRNIDVSALAHFAKRGGRLLIDAVSDIPEPEKSSGEDSEQ